MRIAALSFALLAVLSLPWIGAASAGGTLPTGGQFAAGSGAIAAAGNSLTVNQISSHAIVNWQTFSIGKGNNIQINNGSGATLNRVTTANPSTIAGSLTSTGSVYLINQNGIIVMPTGKVVTGGSFVGSTRDTSDSAFMQGGAAQFTGSSDGKAVNQGSIKAANGDAVLVGKSVANSGAISASNGTTALAAGDDVVLQPSGSGLQVKVHAGSGDVTNTGTVEAAQAQLNAAGGNVYALAGSNGGVVRATGIANINGHVWLSAGGSTTINGAVSAQNADGSGGAITATGTNVTVGGALDASATSATAPGGNVSVKASGNAKVTGVIRARAGRLGGNGGAIETSGGTLRTAGAVIDAAAPNGIAGTWLLDPVDLTVGSGDTSATQSPDGAWTSDTGGGLVLNTDIDNALNAGTSVVLQTGGSVGDGLGSGDITVSAPIQMTGGAAASLTLKAAGSIIVDQEIGSTGGALAVTLNANTLGGGGSVDVEARISTQGGDLAIGGQTISLAAIDAGTGTVTLTSSGPVVSSGAMTASGLDLEGSGGNYTLINAGNAVTTLAANTGSVNYAQTGDLFIGAVGSTAGVTADGMVQIATNGGNLTIANGAGVTAGGSGNALVLKAGAATVQPDTTGGDFINNGGAAALSAPNGHWLVYTGDRNGEGTVDGELDYFARFDFDASHTPPAPRNYILFRSDPIYVSASLTGTVVKTYDGTLLATLDAANYDLDGVAGADRGSVSLTVNGATVASPTAGAFSTKDVGSGLLVTVSGLGLNESSSSPYVLSTTTVMGNIGAITPATLTYVADPTRRTYGADNPVLTGKVTGFVPGENLASATTGVAVFTGAATASSNVGAYAITGSGLTADNGDYVFVQATHNKSALTVKKAILAYVAAPISRTYGAGNPAFTGTETGFVLGQTLETSTTGVLAFTSTAKASSNAGNYAIKGSGLAASNYAFVQAPHNLTALTVKRAILAYVADPVSRTYGEDNPDLSGTVTGFVLGQTLETATTGTLEFNTVASKSSNVGSYAVRGSGLTAIDGNYTFVQAPGNPSALSVAPATLVYTADPASRTYGADNPNFTGTVTGFVLGETLASATGGTLKFTTAAPKSSDVGVYAIKGGGLTANNGNYVFTQAQDNSTALTVTPAVLTYVANPASRTYGAENQVFRGAVTGFVLDDTQATATSGTLSFTSPAAASSDVGNYAVVGAGLAADNGNYVFVQAAGNATALTVTPAKLTYVADQVSVIYGADDPALGGTVTGFVLGQTQATATTGTLSFTSAATSLSELGSYPVFGSGLTANRGNYVFVQAHNNAFAMTILTNHQQPGGPALLGQITNATVPGLLGAYDVYVSGTTAFVTTQQHGSLIALDVSNPANPTFISESPRHFATDNRVIAMDGNYAFVSNPSHNAILVYDISNPANIIEAGSLISAADLAGVTGITRDGNTLYASAIKSNDLVSIDISTPTAPTIIGALPITSAQNVKIYTPGTTAVVSSQLGGAVYSVDISNPAAMSVLSSVTGIAGADQILTDSNTSLAYVSTRVVYPSEFYTFSVGANGALSLVNTTPNLGGATILRKGDDLFLPGPLFNYNDKHSSLNIASIADPTAPTQTYIGPADLVEARGTFIDPANPGILYLTNDSGNGFQIYDISQIP